LVAAIPVMFHVSSRLAAMPAMSAEMAVISVVIARLSMATALFVWIVASVSPKAVIAAAVLGTSSHDKHLN
jgi:hypothetical protein